MINFIEQRKKTLAEHLKANNIDACIFEDSEQKRNPLVRYYSNHIEDAILIITQDAKSILCPWDENLAKKRAYVDKIVPFTKYDRYALKAIPALLKSLKLKDGARVEISPLTPYPLFLHYVDVLPKCNVLCRENGSFDFAIAQRACKDNAEISLTKKAAEITNNIIDKLEEQLKKNKFKTELDVALFIEKSCRAAGCERTSFETLAAGPTRSFAIHCFPSFTNNPFPDNGLSILDFGVCYEGYASDVTLTIAKGELTPEQNTILTLVEKAYKTALPLYAPGNPVRLPATKVDEVFAKAKFKMPHSLGHGTGLEIHEFPFVRSSATPDTVFAPGMIVTLEPGLYDPQIGGCRLENDILITDKGNEQLTKSRIIRL